MKQKLLTLLTLLVLCVTGAWAEDIKNHSVTNPTTDVSISGPITIQGTYNSSKKIDNSNQAVYITSDAPLYIQSMAKNIKAISLVLVGASSGTGTATGATIKTMNGATFTIPETGFSATLDESNLASLENISISKVQTGHNTIEVSFDSPVSAVSIEKGSIGAHIKTVSVDYDNDITSPALFSEGHFTSTTTGTATGGCSWGTFTLSSTTQTVETKTYYRRNSADAITFNLAEGEKFAEGDVILIDFCGNGASKTVPLSLTNGPSWSQKTATLSEHNYIYVIPSGSALINASSFSFAMTSNDICTYGVRVYHNEATPTLTGAWKVGENTKSSDVIVQGASAPTMPTFTVGATSGTPVEGVNYTVTYSFKSGYTPGIFAETAGNPTIVNGQPSIASTSVVGSATIVATLVSLHTGDYEDADPNTFEYTVTVNAPATPITLAWDKISDIVATNSVVTAPVFSNDGGLEVNTTNFNFAITGTAGIISVADNGIVTIDSSVKGEATVTASVIATGYSADPVAYTIRVADAATKWDFTTVDGTVDEYNLSADAAGDGILWTYDSGNNRYKNKYDSENHTDLMPTANSNYLTVTEGLLLSWDAADRFRIDIKGKRAWANGGAVIKITNLKAGQKVSVRHKASGSSSYPRGFETSNLSNTSDFSLNDTNDHTATGYVTADGTVTLTAQGGGTYLYTITVEDYVPVTVTTAGLATYASDNDLDFSGVTGIKAYKASISEKTITFTKMDEVKAGEGMLIRAMSDLGETTTFYVPVTTGVSASDVNAMKRGEGNAVAYNPSDGIYNYVLSGGDNGVGFYQANGETVPTNRAYLQSATALAKGFVINFDDEDGEETDGIAAIESQCTQKGDAYNLAGQKVGADYKGIVIVNGKKYLRK